MICFEIHRNGARLCLAGLGEGGALHAILGMVDRTRDDGATYRDLTFDVGGLHEPEPGVQAFVDWVKLCDLAVGDEITLRIVEAQEADPPAKTRRTTEEEVEAAQRQYYESMKAKFDGAT